MSAILLNQFWLAIYPVAAVSSQTLLDFTTFLMLLTTSWLIYKKRERFLFKRIGIEWAFAGYLLVVILGFLINSSSDSEWKSSIIKFSWYFNLYILIYAFQAIELKIVRVIQFLSVLSLGPTLYALISYMHGIDLITGRNNARITGLVNSSTYHAHGNAVLFVILMGCLLISVKKLPTLWKYFSILSTFLLGLSILFTFTRGIWLSIFISSALMLLFLDWKKLIKFTLASVVIFFISLQVWPKFKERIQQTNLNSNEERVSLFKVNVQIWKEYPLLGIGYGENLRRNREYWDRPEWNKPADYITSHAHNQFLNVASTTGVFGLLFFCSIVLFFFKKNWTLLRKTSSSLAPQRYALLIICFWVQLEFFLGCLTDVSFEYAKIRALILMIWAFLIAVERKPEIIQEF